MATTLAAQTAARHYDRAYYTQGPVHDAPYHLLQRLPLYRPHIRPQDELLDFGCSDGGVLAHLAARRKIGVEINPHARALARSRGLNVLATLDEVESTFSRIISGHCLEHIPNPAMTLERLRELLRADGLMILNLPLNDCRDARHRQWRPGDENMHLHAWTPLTLGNLLWVCGFQPCSIRVVRRTYPARWGQSLAAR
ncbi:MAG TPA: class I SAM-dependent methyltransferase, partial [Pirellulaceae bacterium]